MVLNGLTRGQAHGAVATLGAKINLCEELLGRQATAGYPSADHHRQVFALLTLLTHLVANVPIVLLIGPMMLQELNAVFTKSSVLFEQFVSDLPAEIVTGSFDFLDRTQLDGSGSRWGSLSPVAASPF